MKLARVGPVGQEQPVVLTEDGAYDFSSVVYDLTGEFFASGGLSRVRDALAANELPRIEIEGLRVGAPIARPSAVICIGMNYAAHAAESGAAPPERPVLFLKTPNTVGGPYDDVQIPRGSEKTDWEVELAVVIGQRTAYLDSLEQSLDHISGFTVCNDLSERAFQLEVSGGQWGKGKSCRGFSPTGPWLVTPDEVDHTDLRLQSWVNGEPRQDSTTADLIFGVEQIVYELSQYLVLEPGDLVLTGTPEGVALSGRFPYLEAGDVRSPGSAGSDRCSPTGHRWRSRDDHGRRRARLGGVRRAGGPGHRRRLGHRSGHRRPAGGGRCPRGRARPRPPRAHARRCWG